MLLLFLYIDISGSVDVTDGMVEYVKSFQLVFCRQCTTIGYFEEKFSNPDRMVSYRSLKILKQSEILKQDNITGVTLLCLRLHSNMVCVNTSYRSTTMTFYKAFIAPTLLDLWVTWLKNLNNRRYFFV